jgi:hypothetical protein
LWPLKIGVIMVALLLMAASGAAAATPRITLRLTFDYTVKGSAWSSWAYTQSDDMGVCREAHGQESFTFVTRPHRVIIGFSYFRGRVDGIRFGLHTRPGTSPPFSTPATGRIDRTATTYEPLGRGPSGGLSCNRTPQEYYPPFDCGAHAYPRLTVGADFISNFRRRRPPYMELLGGPHDDDGFSNCPHYVGIGFPYIATENAYLPVSRLLNRRVRTIRVPVHGTLAMSRSGDSFSAHSAYTLVLTRRGRAFWTPY